jgi:hypothetical protein
MEEKAETELRLLQIEIKNNWVDSAEIDLMFSLK